MTRIKSSRTLYILWYYVNRICKCLCPEFVSSWIGNYSTAGTNREAGPQGKSPSVKRSAILSRLPYNWQLTQRPYSTQPPFKRSWQIAEERKSVQLFSTSTPYSTFISNNFLFLAFYFAFMTDSDVVWSKTPPGAQSRNYIQLIINIWKFIWRVPQK